MPQPIDSKIHFVSATGIICKDNRFLIVKRAGFEKAFPNKWTVPGGKLDSQDYLNRPKDASELWYNVIEDLVEREIKEEVNLKVKNLQYVTSMTYVRPDGLPALIVSLAADYENGEVTLCKALTDFAWVTADEAKQFDLIDGILDELVMVEEMLKTGHVQKWTRVNK